MLKPKSLPFRRSLIAILMIVGLLLPTLHFHPGDDHAHGTGAALRHGVIHADFFAVSGHDHSAKTEDHNSFEIFDLRSPSNDQVNLVALRSHQVKLACRIFETVSALLYYEEPTGLSLIFANSAFLERDHPPPITEFYPNIGSPRSPPRPV
jgi:hypothetical protein